MKKFNKIITVNLNELTQLWWNMVKHVHWLKKKKNFPIMDEF